MATWNDGLPEIETERLTLRIADEGDILALMGFSQEQQEHFRPWFPINALTGFAGMVISYALDVASGPSIVLTQAVCFCAALAISVVRKKASRRMLHEHV